MRPQLFLISLCLALPAVGHAQPAPKEASQHFQRGLKLFDEQDFRAALIEFRRAFDIAPSPNVLYNIGQSCYQLQDYVCAQQTFDRYLREMGDKMAPERRKEIEAELGELKGRIAYLTITTTPPGAEVSIDENVMGKTPFTGPQPVSAGRRRITATLEGQPPVSKTIDVAGGDQAKITLTFSSPSAPVASSAAPATTTSPPPPPKNSPTSAYVSFGVGAVGLSVGSIFGLLALSSKSKLDDACSTPKSCPRSAQQDIDALKRNGTVSTLGFLVGAIGVGAGVVLLTTGSPAEARERGVSPWIGLGSAGLTGRF
jgi:hypothetical protein